MTGTDGRMTETDGRIAEKDTYNRNRLTNDRNRHKNRLLIHDEDRRSRFTQNLRLTRRNI